MSFDYPNYSGELARAIRYANGRGVLSVASAGNERTPHDCLSERIARRDQCGITSNSDIQSILHKLWRAASLISRTRRRNHDDLSMGHLCCGMGHLISTPMVAGTAALMLGTNGKCNASNVASGLKQAAFIADPDLAFKRLDVYRAAQNPAACSTKDRGQARTGSKRRSSTGRRGTDASS